MRDAFERVRNRMREIVHGIDAPFVARPVMRNLLDAIQRGIAHVEVSRGHVDLRPKNALAFFEFARAHPREQVQVFCDGTIAIGTVPARFGQGSPVFADLICREVLDVGLAFFDELNGALVEFFKIVGSVVQPVAPVEAQPADVAHDVLFELHGLLVGIGVVEAKIAQAVVFGGDLEVQAQRFRVADMQVPVGFGREARVHFSAIFVGFQVFCDSGSDKVQRGRDVVLFNHRYKVQNFSIDSLRTFLEG